MTKNQRGDASSRFWSKVDKTGECWLWRGARTPRGYGSFWLKKRLTHAHRAAWELQNGEIPTGICVLHRCDNRACVRPSHLFLGTNKENTADMIIKRRGLVGSKNGQAKLTPKKVAQILHLYSCGYTQSSLSKRFKVCPAQIHNIVRGHSWKTLKQITTA